MQFVIVSGMSGAGKSTALKMMEDIGFFCVDNLPVQLIFKFAELAYAEDTELPNVALGLDIRSGDALSDLPKVLTLLENAGYDYDILFLDASEDVLVKRYKETRRAHPLARIGRIEDGIRKERQQVAFLRKKADMIIDTSNLLTRELKSELDKIFVQNENYQSFIVTTMSFGFKYGIPRDADLVFDVRFLPNPYYDLRLRPQTGHDTEVQEYVMDCEEAAEFMNKLTDMIEFLIPNYIKEGKNQLVVAIGCTGGKHRSVTVANYLHKAMEQLPYSAKCYHRDIGKDAITKG